MPENDVLTFRFLFELPNQMKKSMSVNVCLNERLNIGVDNSINIVTCQQDGVSIKLTQPTQTPTEKLLILSPDHHLISIQGNDGHMVLHNAYL